MSFKRKLFSLHWSKRRESLDFEEVKMRYKNVFFKCFSKDGRPDKCLTFLLEKCWRRWLSRALNCCSMPPCPYFCRYAAQLTFVAGSFWSRIHPTPKSGFDAFGKLEMRCCCWRHFYHFWGGGWVVVCRKQNQPLVAQGSTSGRGRPNWEYRRLKSQLPGIIQACKN